MSINIRRPETTTVHCPHCKWLRTVFEDNSKRKSLAARAKKTLEGHMQIHKKKAKKLYEYFVKSTVKAIRETKVHHERPSN